MARKTNGLTKETVDRFVIDAGAVYLNVGEVDERLLGATRGGNEFTIDQDIKLIEIDGVKGATMGARRIVESNATLKVNLLELTSENIIVTIYNALSDDSFELAFEDREEGALEITFTAHYDPENVEEEPWSIDFPKEVTA